MIGFHTRATIDRRRLYDDPDDFLPDQWEAREPVVSRASSRRRRARSSRIAYPILFGFLFVACLGLAAATDATAWLIATPTPTATATPPPTLTATPSATATLTATPSPTVTPPPTATPTPTVTPTPRPTGRFRASEARAMADCSRTVVQGTLYAGHQALNGVRVRVWWPNARSDQLFSLPSADNPALGPGTYEVTLDSRPKAGWWLVAPVDDAGTPLADAVVVQTTDTGCEDGTGRQRILLDFERVEGDIGTLGVSFLAPPTPTPPPPTPTTTPLPTPDGTERVLRVPILMYHYISVPPPGSDRIRRDLSVGPDVFRAHLVTLREQGYTSITLAQLLYAMQRGDPLPPRPIVLTFDDGYRDNYSNAFPILQQEGFVGTFFVVTEPVEERNNAYMTWEQLVEMQQAGMEIASHTHTHPQLPGKPYEDIWAELALSRALLEQRLGREVRIFSYPAGRFDHGVVHLAHEAGYWLAVSTRPGVTHTPGNLMTLRRIRVHGGVFPPRLMEVIDYWMTQAAREP